MEKINREINKLEVRIRGKIGEFDEEKADEELKFKSIYKNILSLWIRREQLLNDLNEQIDHIEQNDQIKLNKVIAFNKSKLNNACFLREFSKLVDDLETIHRLLNECVQHDREKAYDQFVTKIRSTDNAIRQLQESLEKNCYSFDNEMYEVFSKEMNSILKKMHLDSENLNKKVNYDLKHIWDQNLILRKQEGEKLTLNFDCKLRTNTNQLSEYLNALDKNYLLEHLVNGLGRQLIETIINTILNKEVTLDDFEILSVDSYDTLQIQFLNQQTDLFNGELIFACVATLMRFLQMIFESNQLVLRYLNPTFRQIFRLLNDNVLNQLLPSRESELPNYTNYVKRVEELQNEAIESGCLNKADALNFSNSINLNFVNKLCHRYLIKARRTAKRELWPIKEVGQNYLVENRLNTDSDIGQTLYSFPKCQISESTLELVELLKEILNEIKTGNPEHRKDLYLTCRRLCELYTDVSLIKHQKKLNESIGQAAIFHNNCFYLAHELVKLSNDVIFSEEHCVEEEVDEISEVHKQPKPDETLEELKPSDQEEDNLDGWANSDEQLNLDDLNLSEDEGVSGTEKGPESKESKEQEATPAPPEKDGRIKKVNVTLNLVDFIPLLRDVGSEQLLGQMKKQKQQILDILQDPRTMQNLLSDQASLKSIDQHPFQKAIGCVLDKVFALRGEILNLLPNLVVTRITCTLLNTLIQEVFHKILKLEDIPERSCSILLSALNFIESFLNETEELQRLTLVLSDYHKLLEMRFVLKANLQEIADRWEDGDGPLTLAFSPDQLKHMIRALFQNTERRAALLSKIK